MTAIQRNFKIKIIIVKKIKIKNIFKKLNTILKIIWLCACEQTYQNNGGENFETFWWLLNLQKYFDFFWHFDSFETPHTL